MCCVNNFQDFRSSFNPPPNFPIELSIELPTCFKIRIGRAHNTRQTVLQTMLPTWLPTYLSPYMLTYLLTYMIIYLVPIWLPTWFSTKLQIASYSKNKFDPYRASNMCWDRA